MINFMHNVMINEGWINYAYNNDYFIKDNPPQDNMVVSKGHAPYIEAIVAAIYYDYGSYDKTKRWIL